MTISKKKFYGLITFFMVLTLILAGCSTDGTSSDAEASSKGDTIRIGLQAPMTGDNAQYGQDMKNGVDLAFKKINAEGGVNGKKLELIVGDDKATPSEAVAVVNKMIMNDNVKAIIGGYNSSPTLAAQEVSKNAKALHIHMGASPEFTTLDNEYLFRIILTGQVYVPAVLQYMAEEKGTKKIASLYENTDYGITMLDSAKQAAKSLDVEFIANETYNPGDKNFSSQLSKIKKLKPDAVMIVGLYNEVALIAQQAKQAGLDVQFFSPDDSMYSEQLIELGGDAVENHIFASMINMDMDTEAMNEFMKLSEENKIEPEANTAIAYDAAMTLANAFEEGGDSPEKVRDALAKSQLNGTTGTIQFDEDGERSNAPMIMQVKDQKFVVIQE
ncbi:ABC transporter substrate-binding protein [Sporosarcina newyorkensis]|uniref:Branched-chain amino acid transport system substrate-binding protein n=2 Tax=Sporosarcina newyorkensis TaxID=759851 RepID=A0A1T4Y124_9BACL|nr:ABC transporter substrate-binding protein [Sporosarcina newyorkensis]EGQ26894.1 branched chain amino acid ABC superfamily ATP binding cassette transporter, binding protein [Sporosarcina newyorkensis 2681]SKA95188.1 branched-chain amino acid transport system substrate-binding protein [Sporosarcina newyorkensis]